MKPRLSRSSRFSTLVEESTAFPVGSVREANARHVLAMRLQRWQLLAMAVIAVVVPTILLAVSDGLVRLGASLFLLVLPVWWVSRTRSRWNRTMAITLAVVIGASSGAMTWQYTHDKYGGLVHTPMAGSTDQKDFTLMAWTWMDNSSLGVAGGYPAQQVVDSYDSRVVAGEADRYQEWTRAATQSEAPRPYSYRAPAYPLLVGSVWKLTGYQPDHAVLLNVALLALAVFFLTIGTIKYVGLAGGILAGLVLAVSSEPMRWASQGLSESLSVLLVSVGVVATLAILRGGNNWWWLPLGVALGLLGLTKQMFIVSGALYLVSVAAVVLVLREGSRRRVLGAAAGAGLIAATLVAPWLAYNVSNAGTMGLATGTAGWHDMAASYSRAYLAGEDRHSIRERHFDNWELRTGQVLSDDVARAKVGRLMWESQLEKGAYLSRLPQLMTYKVLRTLPADSFDWLMRVAALGALVVILRVGNRLDRLSALCLIALPACLLFFISLTVEAGSRLMVTGAVCVAVTIGLALQVLLDRDAQATGLSRDRRLEAPSDEGSLQSRKY